MNDNETFSSSAVLAIGAAVIALVVFAATGMFWLAVIAFAFVFVFAAVIK